MNVLKSLVTWENAHQVSKEHTFDSALPEKESSSTGVLPTSEFRIKEDIPSQF